jgi:glycosyltransferase involved in cell wall biosynthesis
MIEKSIFPSNNANHDLVSLWDELGGAAHRPDYRFDSNFYRSIYSDVTGEESDCINHFAKHGLLEGRVPNRYQQAIQGAKAQFFDLLSDLITDPRLIAVIEAGHQDALELAFELVSLGDPIDKTISNFSQRHYLRLYKDIAEAGIDPLTHYLKSGFQEQRRVLDAIRTNVRKGTQDFDPTRPTCLICTHEFSRSGAPVVARDMAREAAHTHNVVVMALRDGALLNEFIETACHVIVSTDPFEDWDFFGVPELETIDFAILNSVETFPFIKPIVASGIPCAAYIHEYFDYILPNHKATFIALFANAIIFSSSVVRKSWDGLLQDVHFNVVRDSGLLAQAKLNFTPIEKERCFKARARLSAVLGIDCGTRRIVYGAGEMQIRKGTDLFVIAAQHVREIDPETLFVWIGNGANHEDIHFGVWLDKHMREANANAPDGNLFVIPAGPYYLDVAAAADVLFLPSRLDPLPNVVFDAAKNGCTTVVFQNATGFDDANYDNIPSLERIPYGDLTTACRSLLRAPRKLSTYRYPPVHEALPDVGQNDPNIFNNIKTIIEHAGAQDTALPAAVSDISVLFRDDGMDALEAPRRQEFGRLTALGRRAIWPDVSTAREALIEEGGWMHRRSVIEPHASFAPNAPELVDMPPLHIHVHAHYLGELAHDFSTLVTYRLADEIVVTTDTDSKKRKIEDFAANAGLTVDARVVSNQGRDILPFLHVVADHYAPDTALWCHVHQKKSISSTTGGDAWRAFLMQLILGSETHVAAAVTRISRVGTGLVTAFDPYIVGWAGSRRLLPDIERRLGRSLPSTPLLFPVGNMFWTRAGVARGMLDLFGSNYAWPNEPLPNDGTVYHMIERLWPAIAAQNKLESVFMDSPGSKRI